MGRIVCCRLMFRLGCVLGCDFGCVMVVGLWSVSLLELLGLLGVFLQVCLLVVVC